MSAAPVYRRSGRGGAGNYFPQSQPATSATTVVCEVPFYSIPSHIQTSFSNISGRQRKTSLSPSQNDGRKARLKLEDVASMY